MNEEFEEIEEAVQVPGTEIPKKNPFRLSDEEIAKMQREYNRRKSLRKSNDKEEKEDEELLKEDNSKLNEDKENNKIFSGIEFEKKIPHTMRFKQYDVLDDNEELELYWVTQQFFGKDEVEQFANAFKETGFERVFVTVRDLSTYQISTDEAKDVFVIIDKNGNIDSTGYVNKIKEIGYDFDYETGEWLN